MDQPEVLVIVEVTSIRDPETLKAYRTGARAQFSKYGGMVLARGGALREGGPALGEVVVQKWPSEAQFVRWQDSEEYRPLRELRSTCADFRISIVPCSP